MEKVNGMYLDRAVDSEGNTIDFYLSESRDKQAVKRFFKKALAASHMCKPHVITVDKNSTDGYESFLISNTI